MTTININDSDRNRGLEVLLYKKEDSNQKQVLRQFNLRRVFSFLNREISFQVELTIKSQNDSREK